MMSNKFEDVRCQVCNIKIEKVFDAKYLREKRYCRDHLPFKFRCQAITKNGNQCKHHTSGRQDYCRTHRKSGYEPIDGVINKRKALEIKLEKRTEEIKNLSYHKYIKSKYWLNEKRPQAIERAGNKCQLCNQNGKLHVHHRNYDRLGLELPMDLTVLCERCHNNFHAITGKPKDYLNQSNVS